MEAEKRLPIEWNFVVQDYEDYVLNGAEKPDGQGWTFEKGIATENKYASLWKRPMQG